MATTMRDLMLQKNRSPRWSSLLVDSWELEVYGRDKVCLGLSCKIDHRVQITRGRRGGSHPLLLELEYLLDAA